MITTKRNLKKIVILLVLFMILIEPVYAKNIIKLQECEYNKDYVNWLNLDKKTREKTIMPPICKVESTNVTNLKSEGVLGNSNDSKFDLRELGYVTPARNQGKTGTCWAFSTSASIESNLLINGYEQQILSPGHLELSTQNTYPLSYKTLNRIFNTGGSYWSSQPYLLNRKGPVLESDFPFSIVENLVKTNPASYNTEDVTNKKAIFNVNNIAIFGDDVGACQKNSLFTNDIKKYLVNNGALMGTMYFDLSELDYNSEKNIIEGNSLYGPYHYYSGSLLSDHAITIVGWDDNIKKENFKEGNRPTEDGAWIIKNSWGTEIEGIPFGEDGFFYVSYQDKNICGMASGFYDIDEIEEDNLYYSDYLGSSEPLYFTQSREAYTANVYTKKSSGPEYLEKITFDSQFVGQTYEIYFDSDGDLKNLTKITSGVIDHAGYTTIFPSDIVITNNKYGIVVKLGVVNFNEKTIVPFSIMASSSNSQNPCYNAEIVQDVSYISTDGNSWADTAKSYQCNLTIRAYTSNLSEDDIPPTTSSSQVTTSSSKSTNQEETTTTSKTSSTPKEDDNKINDDATIVIEPNPNNGDSHIPKTENPKTIDNGIDNIVVVLIILGILITIGVSNLTKKENN